MAMRKVMGPSLTLRTMTPRWLDEAPLRPLVLTFAQARVEHGGEGALYVLLRRR